MLSTCYDRRPSCRLHHDPLAMGLQLAEAGERPRRGWPGRLTRWLRGDPDGRLSAARDPTVGA